MVLGGAGGEVSGRRRAKLARPLLGAPTSAGPAGSPRGSAMWPRRRGHIPDGSHIPAGCSPRMGRCEGATWPRSGPRPLRGAPAGEALCQTRRSKGPVPLSVDAGLLILVALATAYLAFVVWL